MFQKELFIESFMSRLLRSPHNSQDFTRCGITQAIPSLRRRTKFHITHITYVTIRHKCHSGLSWRLN